MFVAAFVAAALSTSVDTRGHQTFYRHINLVRASCCDCTPAMNGRLWVSPSSQEPSCDIPGRSAYGAGPDDHSRFYVRFGHTRVGFSPWQRLEGRAYRFAENARQQWLRDHGYVGGVRTFVNDALHAQHSAANQFGNEVAQDALVQGFDQDFVESDAAPATVIAPQVIVPRATISLPPETPRFRKRMRVYNDAGICAPQYRSAGVVTIRGDAHASGVIRVIPAAAPASVVVSDRAVALQ
jgi:hypothetical protein